MQTPTIQSVSAKYLIGDHMTVSVQHYDVSPLWRRFMPKQKNIANKCSSNLYSFSVYPSTYFQSFDPSATFEKWAAVEVPEGTAIPEGLTSYLLPGGMYAVFQHKGDAQAFSQLLQFIYEQWIPQSGYRLDDRPHVEVLGEKYKNNDPESEEEIWIPIA